MAHERPVPIASVLTEAEAMLIADELKREGIEATTSGAITGGMRAEAPGYIKVLVHESDVTKGVEIIERIRKAAREIDWSKVDVGDEIEGEVDE